MPPDAASADGGATVDGSSELANDVERLASTPSPPAPHAENSERAKLQQQQSPYLDRQQTAPTKAKGTRRSSSPHKQRKTASSDVRQQTGKTNPSGSAESPTRPQHGRALGGKQARADAAGVAEGGANKEGKVNGRASTHTVRLARSADHPTASSRQPGSESPTKMVRSADPSGSRTRTRSIGTDRVGGEKKKKESGTLVCVCVCVCVCVRTIARH